MALPPTIPTSFVPHPGNSAPKRYRADLTGAFAFFSYGVLGIVVLLAFGVFFYGRILASDKSAKDATLQKAEANLDPKTVNDFVRLQDRLNSGAQLLGTHVAFSGFFDALDTMLPSTVQFNQLALSIDAAGTPTLKGTGTAKDFNALAAASNSFATGSSVKDAIFSNIKVNQGGSVGFDVSATLDPKLIAYNPSLYGTQAPPAQTSVQAPATTATTSAPGATAPTPP